MNASTSHPVFIKQERQTKKWPVGLSLLFIFTTSAALWWWIIRAIF